ncbi:MAG: hypothetical protein IJ438_01335 [Clostridia bacterium]|nr:hypothetical protein [Clostridia bacterium]
MMKHRLTSLFLALAMFLLPLSAASAQEVPSGPVVNDVGLDLMDNSVHYPQLTGLADETIQTAVNTAIMESGQIEARLNRMAMLLSSPVKLNISYTYTLMGNIFSCAILADGAVENNRATQVWSSVNYDLQTGEALPLASLFADGDAAVAFIETYLNDEVAPELSAHLASGQLTPIPDTFSFSPTGLTLYYDIDDFRTLSDKAGTVTILWGEFPREMLAEKGIAAHLTFAEDAKNTLTAALAGGSFEGIPAVIGQNVAELVDRHALLTDPDLYENSRMIALEDGAFRKVWILTDALREEFDQSVVQGIRADRLNLHGLCTGVTTLDQWREALGEPDATIIVDESQADSWRIVPGTSDYYTLGSYRLRLHADTDGILRSVFLTQ